MIGDLIEIPTAKGFAYAQYTHEHSLMGALIRVFDTVYPSRPENLERLVVGAVRLSTFFPLKAAIHQDIYKIVANHDVSELNRSFPIFRTGIVDPKTKKVSVWWLWDGEKEWKIGDLTPEQRKLPIRGVWNVAMLVQRIEEGWRPEIDHT
ncbi:MAG TPA: hypothetical protein VFP64_01805 [Pyrinomonadaceae bacterium]|nr:hypothetical protein [Pyrinomonadaceae bacterium]